MLTFKEALLVGKARLSSMEGRSSRSEYWYLFLAGFIVNMLMNIVALVPVVGPIISLVVSLMVTGILIFAGARRLHDRNMSAWWLLLYLTGIGILVLLVIYMLPGTPGDNKYGKDPLTTPGFYDAFLKDGAASLSKAAGDFANLSEDLKSKLNKDNAESNNGNFAEDIKAQAKPQDPENKQ